MTLLETNTAPKSIDVRRVIIAPKHHHSSTHNTHSSCHESQQKQHQHLPWLTPHIRVLVISKTISKYYAQKAIVQDVIQTQSGNSGPKAVLLMDNGRAVVCNNETLDDGDDHIAISITVDGMIVGMILCIQAMETMKE